MNEEGEIVEPEDIRKYACGSCFGEFFLRDGIEPSYCPHCGGPCAEIRTKEFGEYVE